MRCKIKRHGKPAHFKHVTAVVKERNLFINLDIVKIMTTKLKDLDVMATRNGKTVIKMEITTIQTE